MTPILILYIKCFVVALLGHSLQTIFKIKSIREKARLANVAFSPVDYFKQDWLTLLSALVTTCMCLFFIDAKKVLSSAFEMNVGGIITIGMVQIVMILFSLIGYTGSDIASRLFSVVNRKVNQIIDIKTTDADLNSGNTDKPTPLK
jgi:hypothetical protein